MSKVSLQPKILLTKNCLTNQVAGVTSQLVLVYNTEKKQAYLRQSFQDGGLSVVIVGSKNLLL